MTARELAWRMAGALVTAALLVDVGAVLARPAGGARWAAGPAAAATSVVVAGEGRGGRAGTIGPTAPSSRPAFAGGPGVAGASGAVRWQP